MISISSRFFCIKYPGERGSNKVLATLSKERPRLRRELNIRSVHSPPVKLAYASYESTVGKCSNNPKASPIIIVHGVLGTKSSWDSLSKTIHQRTNRKVIAVDLRNHGDSPHAPEILYKHMVEDIVLLMKDLKLDKAAMLGHSLGGKAAMSLALTYPKVVEKLAVIDVSPISIGSGSTLLPKLYQAMKNVKFYENSSLSKAYEMSNQQLSTTIKSVVIRQYLLANLVEAEMGKFKWRVNLAVLEKNFVEHMTSLPPTNKTFDGPTLFIGGSQSDYINVNDHEKIKQLFPAAKMQYIQGAGHWVHSQKPKEFLDMLIPFMNETQ